MTTTTSSTAIVTGYTRTYVSGSSGLDTSALIEAAVNAKLEAATTLETQVEENETTIAAYEEMQGYLSDMMDALDTLRNASGSTSTESVFDSRAAYLTASDGTDATGYLGVTVDDGTASQSFTIEVEQLALSHKVGSGTQSSSDGALDLSGSFTLGTEGGESATITVDSGMSLADIATAINATTETSGVQASVLKVSDSSYMLVLSSSETGQTIELTDTDGVAQSLGIVDGTGAFATELQAAQNAIVTIDGVTVESSTNTIEDVLSGVDLDLYAATSGISVTVEVEPDYASAKEAIEAFVTAYNTYREFALTNQTVGSDGTPSDSAVLFGDSILRGTNSAINSIIAELIETDAGGLSLGAIGITFDENNCLVIDDDTLDAAIVDDFDSVTQLFEFQFTSTSDELQVLRDDSALATGTYVLDIETDTEGNITSVSVDGDDTLFTIDGTVLTGADGSAFAGLKLVYSGESATVSITISDGIADLLYDSLSTIADSSSGQIAEAIAALEDENTTKTAKAADITERAYAYEERLIDYYANLEAKIAEAEATMAVIEALLGSDDDD
ncbi:flagellar filament capping protein FliD [Shumkonia mesophila]|uniref:flagellar filament capping protein FliD n=1 Tax=Shumkonia mesophila TaxID=2838854 RepID=UPI0029344312|nr:flagellar filament capping protein FliD [Shumkonia mesophila]